MNRKPLLRLRLAHRGLATVASATLAVAPAASTLVAPTVAAAGLVATALVVGPVAAQPAPGTRIDGRIEGREGAGYLLRRVDDSLARIVLADGATVFGVVKSTVADLKPGSYVGVGDLPQADGSGRAVQIVLFAESQRGVGEGSRPWSRLPGSTMTNATVEMAVAGVDGQVVTLKYPGGTRRVVVPPDAALLAYVPGDRSELRPGVPVVFANVVRRPDGGFEAQRAFVGRDGVVPR